MKERLSKADWTVLSSLKKLRDGEEARVLWPSVADPDVPIGYRHGKLAIETIPGKVVKGTRVPDKQGAVFFEWPQEKIKDWIRNAGRVQIESPGQVEVKRESTKHGGTRRLG